MIETQEKTQGHKRKINGYSNRKLKARLDKKRDEALDRQFSYDSLTLEKKIELVKSRGGSKKELVRLNSQLESREKTKEIVKNLKKK